MTTSTNRTMTDTAIAEATITITASGTVLECELAPLPPFDCTLAETMAGSAAELR